MIRRRRRLRWRLRPLLGLAVVAAVVAAPAASAGVHIAGVDTSGYPAVELTVVTGGRSSAVPRVSENGSAVVGLHATNLGRGKSVVLAIDRSRSMRGKAMVQATAAADRFVLAKPAADSIQVVAFGSRALALTGFSTSTIDADGALRSVSVDGRDGTALYDAIVLATKGLLRQPRGGRVLIVLTDGRDVSSRASLADAVAAAVAAHVAVYPIAIDGPQYTPAPLKRLASATGGSFFRAADESALGAVYSAIASQLARTWRIGFLTAVRPGESMKLRVTVPGQGAAARDVQVPNGPGGVATSPGPSRLLPQSFYSGSTGTLAVALAGGLCVLLAALALLGAKKAAWLKERLEPHVSPGRVQRAKANGERFQLVASLVRATERALGDLRHFRALARLLERADLPLRAAEFAYVIAGSGILVGLIVAVASGSVIGFLLGAVAGGALPVGIVSLKARRRLKAFDDQLPDLLITLAASLKAGHSFRQGIQSAVEESPEPAAGEFRRVLTDTRLGRPMEDSLAEMATRVGSENFTFVMTAVTIQRQVGGSLASLFDTIAETVRQRQQFARRIRALTAMGRMSAYVLVGLPFFLAFVMSLINPRFMAPLWTRHTGHLLIFTALGMMAVGSAILKKIVSFRG